MLKRINWDHNAPGAARVAPFARELARILLGMLMMKLKDMRMGTFKGMTALNKKDPRAAAYSYGLLAWFLDLLPDPRLRQEKPLGRTGRCKAGGGAQGC